MYISHKRNTASATEITATEIRTASKMQELPLDVWSEGILPFLTVQNRMLTVACVSRLLYLAAYNSIHDLNLYNCLPFPSESNVGSPLSSTHVIKRMSRLKRVSIAFCDSFDDESLKVLVSLGSHMEHLELTHLNNLRDISPLFQLCHVKLLSLYDLKKLERVMVSLLSDADYSRMTIESLQVRGCSPALSEKWIEKILELSSTTLRNVSIERMNHLHQLVIPACRCLEGLSLKRCSQFTSLLFSSQRDNNLKLLNLGNTGLDDKSLEKLFANTKFESLQTLRLDRCKKLTKPNICCKSLKSVCFDFSTNLERVRFVGFHQIEELSLSYSKINDHALNVLIRELPSVRKIECKSCKELKRPKISCYDIYSTCGPSMLEELDFNACNNLYSLQLTSPYSPMKKIILNWTKISDQVVEQMVRYCPDLQYIELRTCDNIVSPTITHPNLKVINFSGNHSLISPVLKCKNLERVDMYHCINAEDDENIIIESSNPVTPSRRHQEPKVSHYHEQEFQDETSIVDEFGPSSPPGSNLMNTAPNSFVEAHRATGRRVRRRLNFD